MIKFTHTAITRITMLRTWWTMDITGGTISITEWSTEGDGATVWDGIGGGWWTNGGGDWGEYAWVGCGAFPEGVEG